MKPPACLGLSLLVFCSDIAAHPHSTIEQQALLSIGRDRAVLSYVIRPSVSEGAHIFDHLDSNGNGLLEEDEQAAFARDLMTDTSLSIDGESVVLRWMGTSQPGRETLSAGGGLIEVKVQADWQLNPTSTRQVKLEVNHSQFTDTWFLQPYFFPDVPTAPIPPAIERHADSPGISIWWRGQSSV